MNDLTLQLWGVIGTWVASIGTVAAVITSLWLAYHQSRLKLSITAGHRLLVTPGSKLTPEYCVINIVNRSLRPVNITSISWQAGSFRNKKHFIQVFGTPGFDDVPKVLNEGEVANFMVPMHLNGDNKDWIVRFPKDLAGEDGNIRYIKTLKIVVGTSVGQIFRKRVEKNLINKLLESYKANK